ncbi:MAG: hypothetical protein ACTSYU_13030, partial [Promethearchaeota archaeon]
MAENMEYPYLSYKLLPDGSIFQVDPGEVSSQFININIIAIFFFSQKRLYIWIGEHVSRELQNQIPHIERQILERNPDITILRHFTVEGIKHETEEFLSLLNIPLEEFKKQLIHWDNFQKDTRDRIKDLQVQLEVLKISNEIGKKKEIANQIITLAERISNNQVIQEYEELISSLIDQEEGENEAHILHLVDQYSQTFYSLYKNHEFKKAKEILDRISKILEDSEDRGLIRKWKNFYIKLQQDEELYLASLKKKEQVAEEQIQNGLILELREKIDIDWENSQWREGLDHTVQIIKLMKKAGKFEEIAKFNKRKFGFEEKLEESIEKEENYIEVAEKSINNDNNIVDQNQEDIKNNQINEYDNLFDDYDKQVEDLDEQKNYSAAVDICNKILEILHLTSHNSEIEVWESRKNEFFEKLEVMLNQKEEIEKIEKLEKSYNELLNILSDDEEKESWNYGIGHCREIVVVLKGLGREFEHRQWLQKQQFFEKKLKSQRIQYQIMEKKYQKLCFKAETNTNKAQWDYVLESIDDILPLLSPLNRESERKEWEDKKKSIIDKRDNLAQEIIEEIEGEGLPEEEEGEAKTQVQAQQSVQNALNDEYSQLKDSILEIQKNQFWSDGIKECIRIVEILPQIDKNDEISHYQSLKDEYKKELREETTIQDYSYFDKVDVAQYSTDDLKLTKYPDLLRQANTIESSHKKESKEILLRCLAIIKSDEEKFILKYPKRKIDRKVLEKRLA